RSPRYRKLVFAQPRVEVSQAFRSGRRPVLNHGVAPVPESVFRKRTGWERGIEVFPDSAGEPSRCGKQSCGEFCKLIAARILATDIFQLHRPTLEIFPTRRTMDDWPRS